MTSPAADQPLRLGRNPGLQISHDALDRQTLTPMLQHYADMKDQYPHALLLYRVGDFYETFFQDACTIARELELVLTGKEGGKDIGRIAMAGVPHHALERYCRQLVEKGYAIAICDQVEDPAQAQGLVKREVTRIFTPGTVLDEGLLQPRKNNFLAAVILAGNHWGLAYADVSTGEFLTTQDQERENLHQELTRLQPSEILLASEAPDLNRLLRPGEGGELLPQGLPTQFCYTLRPMAEFHHPEARQRLLETFGVRSLEGLGCERLTLATRAAGGLLGYLADTHRGQPIPLQPLSTYQLANYLILDQQTRRNLELTQTSRDGTFQGSLLWAIDRTCTAMGGRLLRRWLLQPLLNIPAIQDRQATIQELISQTHLRQEIHRHLQHIYDLERLAGRAGSGTANARDLVALRDSFDTLLKLAPILATAQSSYLTALKTLPPELEQLGDKLHATLVESPPIALMEGGLIRPGANSDLDQHRQQLEQDRQWFVTLESHERERTGINSLKVGFNKAAGYHISISRSRNQAPPPDYIRKQTLTNEERYITAELKEREARLMTLQTDLYNLEYEIFLELRNAVAAQASLIRQIATAVASIDALWGLADVAIYQDYTCPELVENRELFITGGRHPVVEQALPVGFFVPNDTHLGGIADLMILTGPNASGKSCYLRQVGLIQLLAQIGSFVPAQTSKLGICDRIFTRVGAVDDLAMGQSTFMVEMNETANILNHATPKSLVLLDEIGRGTATFDGLAIAWSVAEYLAMTIQARTIFATHYHELNELASLLSNVVNYQVVVKELPDEIIFLHQVQPGGADRSYGIEAGRLAGLPPSVIQRARQVMQQIEQHSKIALGLRKTGSNSSRTTQPATKVHQGQLFSYEL
ncbi:DNA mismatch repair protein MutS [Synechococcus sp. PCC 6312]|uniref:DNA mismatch repair protein MutS n=1 Tax=Synechococcus sp. (strain ATCC 27167 / PCC 6312) TaxID=195253 RepID=UPI00029ED66A|nr:DNA mismatch repair protein MutS [Synechococcus sp. PCC 6312]AFY59852.1 DNA mismatch repair protein MutS [Synechococcus sp. PCC 6312]